jgi:hypothetical protein
MSRRLLVVVILALTVFGGWILVWRGADSGSKVLRFENSKPGLIPHTLEKGASASFGRYRWENVRGWVPYTIQLKDSEFVLFIHDRNVSYRTAHVFVAVNTNTGVIMESVPFHGLLLGPGMQNTIVSAWLESGKIHYEEIDNGRKFHFQAAIAKTNIIT